MKIGLFLGAGASVPYNKPTTVELKNKLLEKYENGGLYQMLLEHPEFQDIEYVLTAVRQIVRFSKTLGGKFCVQNTGNFSGHADTLGKFEETLEEEIFENYSWEHSDDETVSKIITPIFDVIKKESNEITVFTTNYDRSIEEYST